MPWSGPGSGVEGGEAGPRPSWWERGLKWLGGLQWKTYIAIGINGRLISPELTRIQLFETLIEIHMYRFKNY